MAQSLDSKGAHPTPGRRAFVILSVLAVGN